jgi:hypothetical protein
MAIASDEMARPLPARLVRGRRSAHDRCFCRHLTGAAPGLHDCGVLDTEVDVWPTHVSAIS